MSKRITIPISMPDLAGPELRAVKEVFESGRLAQGPKVKEFEEKFAKYVGARYGVAVGNGTQALHLALIAHGVRAGDRVIVPAFSFAATATVVSMCGAIPEFVDVNEYNGLINPAAVERRIKKLCYDSVSAIVPVHLYGAPASVHWPVRHERRSRPAVIYDACQAHGAEAFHETVGRHPVGAYGTCCWSFYATKNLPIGEGGMVTTNDPDIVAELRLLRSHGSPRRYEHEILGHNFRMSEMQAAIGIEQLKKLPKMQQKRAANAEFYGEAFKGLGDSVRPMSLPLHDVHAWHQYTLRIGGFRGRNDLRSYLADRGIQSEVYYPTPLPKLQVFQDIQTQREFPDAQHLARIVLSIPVHPYLTEEGRQKVADAVVEWAYQ